MKRSWIFLAILLAAISIVNASPFYVYKRDELGHLHKRAVTFGPCAKASTIVLTVKTIDPDPAPGAKAATTLSFTPAKEIAKGKFFLTTTISEGDPKAPKAIDGGATTADLSDAAVGFTYPIPAGKAIALDVTTAIPAAAVPPYNIEYNFNDGDITIACAIGTVAGAAKGAPPAKGAPDAAPPDAPKGKGGDDAPADAPKGKGGDDAPADAPKGKGGDDAPADAPADAPKGKGPGP